MSANEHSTSESARSTHDWQAIDRRHYLHPFTNHRELYAAGSRIIERADGVYLWDSEGNRILDGMAGLWCVNIGYGRAELAEAANRQLHLLPYYNSFFQCAHPPSLRLAEMLATLTPEGLNRVFFVNSGSEANDTIVRLVRRYWDIEGQPDRQVIISRHNAYHGSTVASASLGGMKPMHAQGGLPIPGIEHIEQPNYFGYEGELSADEFGVHTARALERKILEIGAERVAAFIGEPVQGAGGVIIPPETYWPEIQRICKQYGILLIADEVICGFGRTGRWFGSQRFSIEPDLMAIAKGLSSGYLPIGGVMVHDRIAERFLAHDSEFTHGFTYSGHPAACAVALANLEILRNEQIIEQVNERTGPYLQRAWHTLADHPLVGEVRGVGMLGAIELVADKASRRRFENLGTVGTLCRNLSVEHGLVMRAVGDTMVISPPLVITEAQIDELVDKARSALDSTRQAIDDDTLGNST